MHYLNIEKMQVSALLSLSDSVPKFCYAFAFISLFYAVSCIVAMKCIYIDFFDLALCSDAVSCICSYFN